MKRTYKPTYARPCVETLEHRLAPARLSPTTSGIPALTVSENAGPATVHLTDYFNDSVDGPGGLSYAVVRDSNPTFFSSVTIGSPGLLTLAFTPLTSGKVTLTIQATDSAGLSVRAFLKVTIALVNQPPVRLTGTIQTLTVGEDGPPTSMGLDGLSYGPGGGVNQANETLTYRAAVVPSEFGDVLLATGTTVNAGMQLTLNQLQGLRYHNRPGARGAASFVFDVQNSGGGNDTLVETVPIAIVPFNNPPTSSGPVAVNVLRDAAPTILDLFSSFHHVDYPDTALTYQVIANNNAALVQATIAPGNPTNLILTYGPGVVGAGTIVVEATDPVGLTVSTSFNVAVIGPDLAGTSFRVVNATAYWNGPVQLAYTIANQGPVAAGPFTVDVRLSSDQTIDTSDSLVQTFSLSGVAANSSLTGTWTATLSGGFQTGQQFIGMIINPDNQAEETNHANNSNLGLGLELAPVSIMGTAELEPNDTFATANPIDANSTDVGAIISVGDADYYTLTVPKPSVGEVGGGQVTLDIKATGNLNAKATLFAPDHSVLFQSDDRSPGDANPLLTVHLEPGQYYVAVASSDAAHGVAATGTYTLTARFLESLQPDTFPDGTNPKVIVTGDFNGDGIPDIATGDFFTNVLIIRFGLGDGTFSNGTDLGFGGSPTSMVATDINGDGKLDLIVGYFVNTGDGVTVLLGNGDGTFRYGSAVAVPNGLRPLALAVADLNHDGRVDLIVGEGGDSSDPGGGLLSPSEVDVLLGNSDGTFAEPTTYSLDDNDPPRVITVADVNGDGFPDFVTGTIATSDFHDIFHPFGDTGGGVHILYGKGDGTFSAANTLAGSAATLGLVVGDFNGDGIPDVAAYSKHVVRDSSGIQQSSATGIDVFLGNNQHTFSAPTLYLTGASYPSTLIAADVNHDGALALLAVNQNDNSVSVLIGNGDGTFPQIRRAAVGLQPSALAVADFNGDGALDLVTIDGGDPSSVSSANTIDTTTVVLGNGDGTFRGAERFDVGGAPRGTATADFNGDGVPDLAVANRGDGTVSILLGLGNGTFAPQIRVQLAGAGTEPIGVVAADFNHDGRPDIATANAAATSNGQNTITVAFGVGDGTFHFDATQTYALPAVPEAIVVGDFNGDGLVDIAVAGIEDKANRVLISILQNADNGTFLAARSFATGIVAAHPLSNTYSIDVIYFDEHIPDLALAAGDLTHDGHLDLALVQQGTTAVALFSGKGNGTFGPVRLLALPAGSGPTDILIADLNHDNIPDLAITNASLVTGDNPVNNVAVFINPGDGNFTSPTLNDTFGGVPLSLAVGEFVLPAVDTAGMDLAVRELGGKVLYLTEPDNTGNFAAASLNIIENTQPLSGILGVDLNNDGLTDLVQVVSSGYVDPLLGSGLQPMIQGSLLPQEGASAQPQFADVTGDGVPDVLTLTSSGNILMRRGHVGGGFDAPVVVNVGRPAASFTVYHAGPSVRLAAIDQDSQGVTLYTFAPTGQATLTGRLPGVFASVVVPVDLNGDGLDDLIVANDAATLVEPNLLQGNVTVYLTRAGGSFGPGTSYKVGGGPAGVTVKDLNGDGLPDLVVANRISGDVTVLLNAGAGTFVPGLRLQAGFELYQAGGFPVRFNHTDERAIQAREDTNAVAAGDFNEDGIPDLIAVNSKANTISQLTGAGNGAFVDPVRIGTVGIHPVAIQAVDLNNDGHLDLVVLDRDSAALTVYQGNGHGSFHLIQTISAGNLPSGLAVRDVDGDGNLDAVVSNDFGDVLILLGNGDGTFRPYQRLDERTSLAVAGANEFILGDQKNDAVVVSAGVNLPATGFQDRSNGILAPGVVKIVDVANTQYLVVANSGANDVLVYRANADGVFDPASLQTYPVGTDPEGITLAILNDDLTPDPVTGLMLDTTPDLVVANKGSNDVTILLGNVTNGQWTLTLGPRLKTGGLGPVATFVQYLKGSSNPEILVCNSQSNTVSVLPGVGGGFFNDRDPQTFNVGQNPSDLAVGNFGGGAGLDLAVISSANTTLITNFNSDPVTSFVGSGGSTGLFGDFAGNAFTDVAVAGNGVVSLLLGGENGLTPFEDIAFQDPSSLALASTTNNQISLYVTRAGQDGVQQLTFNGIPVITPGQGGTESGAERRQTANVTAVDAEAIRVVAVVVTGSGGEILLAEAFSSDGVIGTGNAFFFTGTDAAILQLTALVTGIGNEADRLPEWLFGARGAGQLPGVPEQGNVLNVYIIGLEYEAGQLRSVFRLQLPVPWEQVNARTRPSWQRIIQETFLSNTFAGPIDPLVLAVRLAALQGALQRQLSEASPNLLRDSGPDRAIVPDTFEPEQEEQTDCLGELSADDGQTDISPSSGAVTAVFTLAMLKNVWLDAPRQEASFSRKATSPVGRWNRS